MPHMKPDFKGPSTWYEVDGSGGITCIPIELTGPLNVEELNAQIEQNHLVPDEVKDYYDGKRCYRIEVRENAWGVRLAAPGYMDCTEWSVFDTEEKAKCHLWIVESVCPECGADWSDLDWSDLESERCKCEWVVKKKAEEANAKARKKFHPQTGMRLTDCCGAASTFCDATLCCKGCWNPVPTGQGDGCEYEKAHKEG